MAAASIAMAGERDIVGEGERVGGDSASVGEGETVGDSDGVGEGETVGPEAAEDDDDDIAAPSSTDAAAAAQSEIPIQPSFVAQHASMPSNISSHGAFSTTPPQSAVPFGEQSRTQDVPVSRSR